MRAGDSIGLVGPLGAGKTRLVWGVAAGLGVEDTRRVVSPTYVIVREYEARLHLYHVDAYRLGGAAELLELGFEEMCESGGVVLVEWADRVWEARPADHLRIAMEPTGPTDRRIQVESFGDSSLALEERLARM